MNEKKVSKSKEIEKSERETSHDKPQHKRVRTAEGWRRSSSKNSKDRAA